MREVVETEMTSKEALTSHFHLTTKNLTDSSIESQNTDVNEDGTKSVSELLTLQTPLTLNALFHTVTHSLENSSATHPPELLLPNTPFAETSMTKSMVLSLVLMDTLMVGLQTLLVDSMVGDMIETDEMELTSFVLFLPLKFVDSTGEDVLLDKISNPLWKIFWIEALSLLLLKTVRRLALDF